MKKLVKTLLVAGLAVSLSGCVTLLPKTKPAQLYRFGYEPALVEEKALTELRPSLPPLGIIFGGITFPKDSSGDQILTVDGAQASYVAEARWTTGASSLFTDAVTTGFARTAKTVTLEPRVPTAANYRIDISVRKFQTDYTRNKPTVSIAVDARLIRISDRVVVGKKFITADVAVRKNDMSQMADGYNQATTQVVAGLIEFSEATLAPFAAGQPPAPSVPATPGQKVEGL
jgi:cholesterol transport system auxiliary component